MRRFEHPHSGLGGGIRVSRTIILIPRLALCPILLGRYIFATFPPCPNQRGQERRIPITTFRPACPLQTPHWSGKKKIFEEKQGPPPVTNTTSLTNVASHHREGRGGLLQGSEGII